MNSKEVMLVKKNGVTKKDAKEKDQKFCIPPQMI